ncbi:hypothetical protein N7526_002450 [Penicillium atrosanguineum]|nr:hypothetical protein N7526_002450 [Penicillium atrosanguineum]
MELHVCLAAVKGPESTESFIEVIHSTKKTSGSLLDLAIEQFLDHDWKYRAERGSTLAFTSASKGDKSIKESDRPQSYGKPW